MLNRISDILLLNKFEMNDKDIYGLILAAGLSGRMGAYKPLLEYNGKTFLQNVIVKLNSVCSSIKIVTGFRSEDIESSVNELNCAKIRRKVQFIFNEDFEKGMFSSLQKGSGACSNSNWVLYHFVDQPSIPMKFYADFANQIDSEFDWIQPMKNGRNGHPILFGQNVISKIINSDNQSNLRNISQSNSIVKKYWECSFEQIFDDIDTQQDYNNLIQH